MSWPVVPSFDVEGPESGSESEDGSRSGAEFEQDKSTSSGAFANLNVEGGITTTNGAETNTSATANAHTRRNFEQPVVDTPDAHIASADANQRRSSTSRGSFSFGGNPGSLSEPIRSWSRAGLLCPRRGSLSSHSQPHTTSRSTGTHPTSTTSTSNSASSQSHVFSRTPDDIRASTVELSSMAMAPPPPSLLSGHVQPHQLRTPLTAADLERAVALTSRRSLSFAGAFLRPPVARLPDYGSERDSSAVSFSPPSVSFPDTHVRGPAPTRLSPILSSSIEGSSKSSPANSPQVYSQGVPSGLSILLAQQRLHESNSASSSLNSAAAGSGTPKFGTGPGAEADVEASKNTGPQELKMPQPQPDNATSPSCVTGPNPSSSRDRSLTPTSPLSEYLDHAPGSTETSPLLGSRIRPQASSNNDLENGGHSNFLSFGSQVWAPWRHRKYVGEEQDRGRSLMTSAFGRVQDATSEKVLKAVAATVVKSIPAVLLGMLLNILDGVSYGMIMFPSNDIFPNFGGIGVSMFFVTTIVSQLVYSFGGSGFAGANGSMMIEVVPFFHILASEIAREIGEENVVQIVSTTIVAFALSSILTGVTFFILGYLRLGVIIGFFPRHILVGCIGGVGIFLIQTGLAVCARIDDDDFEYSFAMLKFFTTNLHTVILWLPAFVLAVLLRLITSKFNNQLIFPIYFMMIPAIFYVVVAAAGLDIPTLRQDGWIFDMGGSSESWYKFYSYFNLSETSFRALWVTMPTQFALLFFNILHPPLNVPALAVSLNEDVDTNRELVAHGYSNIFAGLLGTVPNYLVYVNTLLFYRVGGTTRVSGFMLAFATFLLLIVGTAPIGYIPIMLVGALIFVLGIDLVKESLWDSRHRASWSEYLTIMSIMVCMTLWDFVIGVLFGIVICCFFFVVQNSRRRSIRAIFTGDSVMSAVRRPSAHRDYIHQVAKQTVVLRLQGFLFFGTIAQVEEAIRDIVEPASWQRNPVRFVVIDLTLVGGIDMSAAEAFVRIQRVLSSRSITMVLCGFSAESSIGKSLENVGLFDEDFVELFSNFSDAMEWTENAYLRAWFLSQKSEVDPRRRPITLPGKHRQSSAFVMTESYQNSPRKLQIHTAAGRTFGNETGPAQDGELDDEPDDALLALSKAFSSYGPIDKKTFRPLLSALQRITPTEGSVLWRQGDKPDGLYIIDTGVLRAIYEFADHREAFEESMVGGTLAGELSALTSLPRNATVVVEKDSVLWKLSVEDMARLESDYPDLAQKFSHLVLKVAKTDYDILLSALAARQ